MDTSGTPDRETAGTPDTGAAGTPDTVGTPHLHTSAAPDAGTAGIPEPVDTAGTPETVTTDTTGAPETADTPATDTAGTPDAVPVAPTPDPRPAGRPEAGPAGTADGGSTGSPATAFGRVDADGTVYVRTADGERAVGSWQAGSPEEGLAHYARRYDDLVTEVGLLEARLATGAADAAHTRTSAVRLRESLSTASVVGDLAALATRLDGLIERAGERAEESRLARAAAREQAVERKNVLVTEAEQLAAESTQWKAAGDRLREILEEWKAIRGVDRKTDGELWKRYAAARDAFNRRRGSHFASLDAARKQVQADKEELVARAETASESTDWAGTATVMKQLMAEWKAAGRAPREAEDQLWKRFRAAQDHFFTRRSVVFTERDAEYQANLAKKEALLAEAEAIDVDADLKAAQAALRDVQSRWDTVGRVPREAVTALDRRLGAVAERVRSATDDRWRRSAAESNPLLAQVREQVAKAERQLERARAAGDARRIAEAEQALASRRQFLQLAERAG